MSRTELRSDGTWAASGDIDMYRRLVQAPLRDVARGVADREDPRRVVRTALHDTLALMPMLPRPLRRSRPLAEPPDGSDLEPVMGDYGWPLLGWSVNWMYRGPLAFNELRRGEVGRIGWTGMFGRKVLMVSSAQGMHEVVLNRDGAFSSEDGWDWIIGPFFDRGLMLLDDPDHHRDRRIMASAFSKKRLMSYQERMARRTASVLDGLQPGRLLAYPMLKQLTLDVATDVFLDEDPANSRASSPSIAEVNDAFIACVRAGTSLIRRGGVPGSRWQRGLDGRRTLERYFVPKIPRHRARGGDDLLSALCDAESEAGESFTDQQILDHIIFLMMAAHDTSTITANAILYFLMAHPEWQERCRDESLALADEPSFTDLAELTSLDLVMKEAQRLIPPVPAFGRMAVADTSIDGLFVPKGTAMMVAPLPVHHDPELWRQAHLFDPERFGPERREDKVHPGAYLPFGGGAHMCIGKHFGIMEVKTIVHQMLRRFVVSQPRRTPSRWDWTSLPKPLDDLPVTLEPLR